MECSVYFVNTGKYWENIGIIMKADYNTCYVIKMKMYALSTDVVMRVGMA